MIIVTFYTTNRKSSIIFIFKSINIYFLFRLIFLTIFTSLFISEQPLNWLFDLVLNLFILPWNIMFPCKLGKNRCGDCKKCANLFPLLLIRIVLHCGAYCLKGLNSDSRDWYNWFIKILIHIHKMVLKCISWCFFLTELFWIFQLGDNYREEKIRKIFSLKIKISYWESP